MRGVTIFELVIGLAIAAVLMALAVPSYRYVTNGNRIAGEVNGLLGDLQFARAEAIKEGQTVTVCVQNGLGTGCAAATTTTWQNGWIVFTDLNSDHTVDAAGDTIWRVQPAFTNTDTFIANNALGYVTFNREGFATGAGIANGVLITLHAKPVNNGSTRCLSSTLVGLMTVMPYDGVVCL